MILKISAYFSICFSSLLYQAVLHPVHTVSILFVDVTSISAFAPLMVTTNQCSLLTIRFNTVQDLPSRSASTDILY